MYFESARSSSLSCTSEAIARRAALSCRRQVANPITPLMACAFLLLCLSAVSAEASDDAPVHASLLAPLSLLDETQLALVPEAMMGEVPLPNRLQEDAHEHVRLQPVAGLDETVFGAFLPSFSHEELTLSADAGITVQAVPLQVAIDTWQQVPASVDELDLWHVADVKIEGDGTLGALRPALWQVGEQSGPSANPFSESQAPVPVGQLTESVANGQTHGHASASVADLKIERRWHYAADKAMLHVDFRLTRSPEFDLDGSLISTTDILDDAEFSARLDRVRALTTLSLGRTAVVVATAE